MAFKTSRTFTSRGRPPRLAGGIAGSTSAPSASVKSPGYRKPRRFAARRCSGVHIEHPLASIRVLDNESHPIPPTQQLLGSALTACTLTLSPICTAVLPQRTHLPSL